jgi:hypothetical protein
MPAKKRTKAKSSGRNGSSEFSEMMKDLRATEKISRGEIQLYTPDQISYDFQRADTYLANINRTNTVIPWARFIDDAEADNDLGPVVRFFREHIPIFPEHSERCVQRQISNVGMLTDHLYNISGKLIRTVNENHKTVDQLFDQWEAVYDAHQAASKGKTQVSSVKEQLEAKSPRESNDFKKELSKKRKIFENKMKLTYLTLSEELLDNSSQQISEQIEVLGYSITMNLESAFKLKGYANKANHVTRIIAPIVQHIALARSGENAINRIERETSKLVKVTGGLYSNVHSGVRSIMNRSGQYQGGYLSSSVNGLIGKLKGSLQGIEDSKYEKNGNGPSSPDSQDHPLIQSK